MNVRRSPCVGICSTTYGDLVCRGCKRFAHEIVQWNGFEAEQCEAVWKRLLGLRAGAVRCVIRIVDAAALRDAARTLGVPDADAREPYDLAYPVLQRATRVRDDRRPGGEALSAIGLGAAAAGTHAPQDAMSALVRIDREFYERSLAHYERNFRIPAQ